MGWKGAKRGATLAVQVLFSFIARLNLWLGSPVLRFILSCRAPMTNGFPRVAIARRVGGEEKNLRYSRGMRGGIGVMDHDLTRSESG